MGEDAEDGSVLQKMTLRLAAESITSPELLNVLELVWQEQTWSEPMQQGA